MPGHRQDRLCTVERLDLALLVDAEHQRAVRRREMQALSRTLSTKCGSLESLNVSERCGCKPKAPQMRQIVVCERPLSSAIERNDQWVASAGVALMTRAIALCTALERGRRILVIVAVTT